MSKIKKPEWFDLSKYNNCKQAGVSQWRKNIWHRSIAYNLTLDDKLMTEYSIITINTIIKNGFFIGLEAVQTNSFDNLLNNAPDELKCVFEKIQKMEQSGELENKNAWQSIADELSKIDVMNNDNLQKLISCFTQEGYNKTMQQLVQPEMYTPNSVECINYFDVDYLYSRMPDNINLAINKILKMEDEAEDWDILDKDPKYLELKEKKDFNIKEEDYISYFSVDLNSSLETLVSDYKKLVIEKQKQLGINFNSVITQEKINEWSKNQIIPYIDLVIWSKLPGNKLPSNRVLGEWLFPDAYDFDPTEKARKLKYKMEIILEPKFISYLQEKNGNIF
ncbi:MAG: hypothetical protein KZQ83_13360 [gamma proteobacterium symbiont of Taylorina sp.]|nr:hypothetical protein [gamma proteobacterium symbiont of Taylorina sp.]